MAESPLKQEIQLLEQQIAALQSQRGQQGGQPQPGGLLAGSQPSLDQERMGQIYGLLAQYADNPAQVGHQYVQSMQGNDQLRSYADSTNSPSSVREWEYYNSLTPEQKKQYLEMKRGVSLKDLAGGKAAVYSSGMGGPEYYSSLGQEAGAAQVLSGAKAMGTNLATRYDTLASSAQERQENFAAAAGLRQKVKANDLPTGQYTGLVYKVLPTADQEKLDALAEFVARQRLKSSGEIRPTDADVQGMKRALFGSTRTEDFTTESLDRLIRELQTQEMEYRKLGQYFMSPTHGTSISPPESPGLLGPRENDTPAPTKDYSQMTVEEMLREANRAGAPR